MAERDPLEMDPHEHLVEVDVSFPDTSEGTLEAFKELCIFGRRLTDTGGHRVRRVICRGGCEGIES